MRADPSTALSLAILVGAGSLGVLRLIDPHEKEPFWALVTFLLLGATAAGAAALVVPPSLRSEGTFEIAVTAETSKAVAIAAGIAVLAVARELKGWSELNGVLDGVVYGAAAGLGFATGATFVSEIAAAVSAASVPNQPAFFETFGTALLFGLSEGALGAIMGAAVAKAVETPIRWRAIALPVAGWLLAVGLHALYAGALLDTSIYDARGLVGDVPPLVLPLALLAAVVVHAIAAERRTLRQRHAGGAEAETQEKPSFLRGELDKWRQHRAAQNRRAQLLMIQARIEETHDPRRQTRLEAERDCLRDSLELILDQGHATDVRRRPGSPVRQAAVAAALVLAVAVGATIVAVGAARERDRAEARRTSLARDAVPDSPVAPGASLLRDRLSQRVGPYALVAAADDPAAAEEGASEAYLLSYRGPGGVVHHGVASFGAPREADEWLDSVSRRLRRAGWRLRRGTADPAVLSRGKRLAVAWSRNSRAAYFTSPERTAALVWDQLPY